MYHKPPTRRAADFQRQTKEATVPGQAALQHRMDRIATVDTGTRNVRDFWVDEGGKQAEVGTRQYTGFNARWDAAEANGQVSTTANLRDFWLLGPEVLREAHYAAYPTEIPRRTILLGTPVKGACATCGAPWTRMIKHDSPPDLGRGTQSWTKGAASLLHPQRNAKHGFQVQPFDTTGWQPTCEHVDAEVVPATVLDPFAGSGTTLLVAKALGRRSIGCELSDAYCKLAAKRIGGVTLPMGVGV